MKVIELRQNVNLVRAKGLCSKEFGDVLVLGGGISGIQASLDMANAGFRVYLVERAPAIGGHMALLDKTFPTNDCSMCIESPKFIECHRHPNIEILTYTELQDIKGEAGNFDITLIKKPRYVLESKCTGCTTCVENCPVKHPDPFNQDLSYNKAIHIYFSQAIPLVTYIDQSCLYLKEGKCRICVGVCKNNAIDFGQRPKEIHLNVGAVLLCPGFNPFDPSLRGEFGYKICPNVVTSLEFERILCSTGPYSGEIRRPWDGKHPKKIAWVQCVGSRQVLEGGNPYCSAVCCTYTQKQVILAKDHDPGIECWIFHNDIRCYGKDFERFFIRASRLPYVRFVRSYVSLGGIDPTTQNVKITYATEEGVKEEEFHLVVLSVGLNPFNGPIPLVQRGIRLNEYGFVRVPLFNPLTTSVPGIFLSGTAMGPMDIPESVVSGTGVAAQILDLLRYRKGKLRRQRVYPPEREISREDPRIGVFVCHCGANIGGVVNVPEVVRYAAGLPKVVHVEEQLFSCSTDSAKQITEVIKEKGLNRVIVAACTPRTHEPLFRDTLKEAGLNPYLFEMANIREHCSWVHSKEREEATKKAKDIVRRAVFRSMKLYPLTEYDLPINKKVLVIGGGISGMTAALSLAKQGFSVSLVEKEQELGGMARRLFYTLEGENPQDMLRHLIRQIYSEPRIEVSLGSQVIDTTGYVGNFLTTIIHPKGRKTLSHGATIIAVGAQEYRPKEYGYGKDPNVITQLELEGMIASSHEKIENSQSIAMIQCVGCRNEQRSYCSRICCSHAIKNAIKLKEKDNGKNVYILFRDVMMYGFREKYYRIAQERGVIFIRYDKDNPPKIETASNDSKSPINILVQESILRKPISIDVDLLILSSAVIPCEDNEKISKLFKIPLNTDGFFQEAHVKLRPVDFAAEGIFLCGTAHYPKHLEESIIQAYGAAGRAGSLLSQTTITASGSVAQVNILNCVSCGACITSCKYGAIEFVETEKGKKARVNPILCKGDGLCTTKCPTGAITLLHFTDEQINNEMKAILLFDTLESDKIYRRASDVTGKV